MMLYAGGYGCLVRWQNNDGDDNESVYKVIDMKMIWHGYKFLKKN